jgi:ABC-type phosphate/phosphonate transport system substrate-binding protein
MSIFVIAVAFLFLKTGEKFATQEAAGPTVAAFTDYVASKIGGEGFESRVFNDPKEAIHYVDTKKPAVGIVSPGFFLAYSKALGMEPLLEAHRQAIAAERYVLVAKKEVPGVEALRGKTIVTSLSAEERYVVSVILQNKLGEEVRLKQVTDLEGAAVDLVEGARYAGEAVLMEEGTWKMISADDELGPKLTVVYRSDELPRDLVVAFKANTGRFDVEKFKAALKDLNASVKGKDVLGSIQVDSFRDVNIERLAKAEADFRGK